MSKIAIYAGHGGGDPGAVCGVRQEKAYTLEVSNQVTALLKAAGHTVLNNRTADVNRDVTMDANKANAWGADAVIEIHLNANSGTPGTGTETYHSIVGGIGKQLAEAINKNIVALGFRDRGAKTKLNAAGKDYFGIIRQTSAPAVLVETAFINNDADMALYDAGKMANAIADGILEVFGGCSGIEPSPAPTPEPEPEAFACDVFYRVRTQAHGWLSEVKNLDDYAGWQDSPVTDIAVRVTKGSVKYRVHVKNGNWLPYVTGCDINDSKNGYAGNGRIIDAVEVYYFTPEGVKPPRKAKYRVAPVGKDFYSWQADNEKTNGQDGFAGKLGREIGKVQIVVE